MTSFKDEQLQEKVEVLDGSRGKPTRRAAVRIEDVEALLTMPEKLGAAEFTGSTPTAVTQTSTAIARTTPADFTLTAAALTDRTLPYPSPLTAGYAAGPTPTNVEFAALVNDVAMLANFGAALSIALRTAPTVVGHNAVVADLATIQTFCLALKPALPQPAEYDNVVADLGAIITYLAGLVAIVPTAAHLNLMRTDVREMLTRLHEVATALQKRVLP